MSTKVCRRSLFSGSSLHLDRKYLLQISGSLRNFVQKDRDLYNCSCNLCGDSKKNQFKARMFFYVGRGNLLMVKCHNCGVCTSFRSYLKQVNPSKFREYFMELLQGGAKHNPIIDDEEEEVKPKEKQEAKYELLTPVASLPNDHECLKYVRDERKIPHERWSELFYCEDFMGYMDHNYPGHGKKLIDKDKRLVWFNTDLDGDVNQVCGRSLEKEPEIRYLKVKLNKDNERRIYGMHSIKHLPDPIYVVEGEIDAMMLDNCIASGDSSLKGLAETFAVKYQGEMLKLVLVYDNQPRNKDIVKAVASAIRAGHWVMIWDEAFDGLKDINKVFTEGLGDKFKKTLRDRSFRGPEAWIRFNEWKKIEIEQ